MNAGDRSGKRLAIEGARIIDPASSRDSVGSIYLADGRIAAIDRAPEGFNADETIDASGLAACPGLIDLAARLREPGFEYRATLDTEMRAAVAGGVTTLVCPPTVAATWMEFRSRALTVYAPGARTTSAPSGETK